MMKLLHFKTYNTTIRLGVFLGILILSPIICFAQVGINTTNPKGALDVMSINNTGLVLPRVSAIEDVTNGNSNPPANGTTVFDLSRNTTCFYINNSWSCIDVDVNGTPVLTNGSPLYAIDYIKASNTDINNPEPFGLSIALSEDGNTLAVGSTYENSNATGINGNQNNHAVQLSGAVFVFVRTASIWTQQAYIKASNSETFDAFGFALTLSNNGNTLAISAVLEDSNATGINGNQNNNSTLSTGAVYVFNRAGTIWNQEAYIKASNPEENDFFGFSVAVSGDGNTLAISAPQEDSNTIGINGDQTNNAALDSGAIYVFTKGGGTWNQQAYIKASNTNAVDYFGLYIALSFTGETLAVGAGGEASNATGVNGNQNDNSAQNSGAVYIFERTSSIWSQQAYLKASNTGFFDNFGGASNSFFVAFGRLGGSISMSDDGNTLAIGASAEDSIATGINGNQTNDPSNTTESGAVYVFVRSGNIWSQQAYIKASNTEATDYFGSVLGLSGDGNTLAISSSSEASMATGINGDQTDNSIQYAGAVYLFKRNGSNWSQHAYIKATNTGVDPWTTLGDQFGYALAISGDGNTLAVGAPGEDSDATGINGNQNDNSAQDAGAVYVYTSN